MPTVIVPLLCDRTKPDPHGVSELALPWARGLARQLSADVVLVTALDIPPGLVAITERELLRQLLDDWRGECRHYLDEVARSFDGQVVERVVEDGDPASAIVRLSKEKPDPLVVMASHLRRGLSRLVLGSVAMHVVSSMGRPVVIVGQRVPVPSSAVVEIRRVLVPLDGSALAEWALDLLVGLGLTSVQLTLLHVLEPAARAADSERGFAADAYLAGWAGRLRERGFDVATTVQSGRPAEVIVAVADEVEADLLAMVTHGRSGVREVFMGSTTEQVLHGATRPVLVARPHDAVAGWTSVVAPRPS
jgi:nucleotide-binding universal stress UspA family protein